MAKFIAGLQKCNHSFEHECVGPSKTNYEQRMMKMLGKSKSQFIKDYNQRLFNWLVSFSLVMVVIGHFIIKFILIEMGAWLLFIFLETYTRMFWLAESLYYNPVWHFIVATLETLVYSPVLDLDRIYYTPLLPSMLPWGYDQVAHDVDLQKLPVRFALDRAGLVSADGPTHYGAFDTTFMACLPNMVVMAPSNETELMHMVATAAAIDDRPSCFRFLRGNAVGSILPNNNKGTPLEVGKVRVLKREARYIEHGSQKDQIQAAGLNSNHIAAIALSLTNVQWDNLLLLSMQI
ncbi:hypothetical protein Ahy_B01g052676 [Arachis hypogaea]|uniref:Transketolase-like pyrimidine-binding domain-containing protein n=1 Tax=Arachis hypogaea TaxID=3818 RepID=A0A445AQ71_ARAHY|nr:hypothetical protein Ahy_B01g052676 [Arachis hypogaea]